MSFSTKVLSKLALLGIYVAQTLRRRMFGCGTNDRRKYPKLPVFATALWGSVGWTSIIPHDLRGLIRSLPSLPSLRAAWTPRRGRCLFLLLTLSGFITCGERLTTANMQIRTPRCYGCALMHRLWLHISSAMLSPALTGLRHAGIITGSRNLNATLTATATADAVAVKTTDTTDCSHD